MLNLKKRFVKLISSILAAVMITFALAPTAAFAYYPYNSYYGYRYHNYYGHHHHSHWTKNDTATVAGLAAVIGLLALVHNNKAKTPPSDPVSYAEYRAKYIAKLNPPDQYVCNKLLSYPAGEYKTAYTQQATVKQIQNFCKKLPKDFQFMGTRVVRFSDGSVKNFIYFNRLEAAEYENAEFSTIVVE